MPNEIIVNEDLGIIEVRSYGVISKTDVLEAIDEINQIFEKQGINKILADTTDIDIAPGTMDLYELSSTFPLVFRHAILVSDFQTTAKDVRFVEDVGVKRGRNIRVFSDREKALRWLNEDQ